MYSQYLFSGRGSGSGGRMWTLRDHFVAGAKHASMEMHSN